MRDADERGLTLSSLRRGGPAHLPTAAGEGGWRWAKLRAAVRERDGGCVRCGATAELEVHHVVPLARGGSTAPANLVTLCRACHLDEHRGI